MRVHSQCSWFVKPVFWVFSTPKKFEPSLTAQEKEEIIYMLSEWGWTGPEDEKPSWVLNDIDHEEDIS